MVSTFVALAGLSGVARADDKKADATGTWSWETKGRDGTTRETTLKLKQDGDKLTGTISGRDGKETEIKDGTVKGDEISFKVTRTSQSGQENTTSYTATVSGDSIKGKAESAGNNGQTRSRPFEAKRKESKDQK
jgi:hypothetical protein